jgi:serine/threonine protein kinase
MFWSIISRNILLTQHGDVKIGDLGLSKSVKSMSQQKQSIFPGTPNYMSPEIVEEDPNYNEKIDVWYKTGTNKRRYRLSNN